MKTRVVERELFLVHLQFKFYLMFHLAPFCSDINVVCEQIEKIGQSTRFKGNAKLKSLLSLFYINFDVFKLESGP